MKTITTIIVALLINLVANAQKTNVHGKIIDQQQQPVAYASIAIKKAGMQIILHSTVTDSAGLFSLSNISFGKYDMEVTAVGFASQLKSLLLDSNYSSATSMNFNLAPAGKEMAAVTVTARKKFIEVKADKTILNIENNIMASGSSVFDMIKKGPAVSADKDDNLKLKGSIAQIFIDGKPAYLSGQQLTDYLKNLPADMASKIEIISNPGSKYEAQGRAGIINIKLKKNTSQGLNGTANAGAGIGRYPKVYGGINLNYRKKKVNVFGNANTGRYESYNELLLNSVIGNGPGAINQQRNNYWHPVTNALSYKAGLDYSISKKSTIGFLVNGNPSHVDAPVNNSSIFRNLQQQPISAINTFKTDIQRTYNNAFNLNFKTTLDTIGSELNIDADYVHYQARREDVNYNYYLGMNGDTSRAPYIFRNQTPANVDIISFKTDYTKYIRPELKIEAGLKTSFVKTDNNLISDSVSNDKWKNDLNRSNHFIYEENINAMYITGTGEWKKWNVQAGLRAEQTNYTAHSITTGSLDKQSYFNLFPTLFLSYKMNDKNTYNFSYTRRIGRPSYQSLNPFNNFIDPYTIFRGNPYLKPSYSNSMELKHSYRDFLFTSLSFTHRSNDNGGVIFQDTITKITTNTTYNIGYSNYAGLDITLAIPITKWWTVENNFGAYLSQSVSTYTGYEYNTSTISGYFSSDHTFTLPKTIKIQAGVNYYAASREGFTRQHGGATANFGIQKTVAEKKGTVKFSVSNIGRTKYIADVKNENLDIRWSNEWEGPRFNLSFSYKFGNSGVKANRSRKTASSEESGRVNL